MDHIKPALDIITCCHQRISKNQLMEDSLSRESTMTWRGYKEMKCHRMHTLSPIWRSCLDSYQLPINQHVYSTCLPLIIDDDMLLQ